MKTLDLIMYLFDLLHVTKSIRNPVNRKFISRCNLLIYSGSHFKVVVPRGIQLVTEQTTKYLFLIVLQFIGKASSFDHS